MPDQFQQIAVALPVFAGADGLIAHLQPDLLGHGARHDGQGQAVAGSGLERLGSVAGVGRVIVDLQAAILEQGFHQTSGLAVLRDFLGDHGIQIGPHFRADREDVGCGDALGRRCKG